MKNTNIFPWHESFKTGISQLDQQHFRLIEMVNGFAGHLADQSFQEWHSLLGELFNLVDCQFHTEEKLWIELLTTDDLVKPHAAAHQQFLTELTQIIAILTAKPGREIAAQILSKLLLWLVSHVLDADQSMAAMSRNQTIKAKSNAGGIDFLSSHNDGLQQLCKLYCSTYLELSSKHGYFNSMQPEIHNVETKLRLSANVFENTLDAICITDNELDIVDINPAFCRISELNREQLLGKNLKTLMSGLNDQHFVNNLWPVVSEIGYWSGEIHDNKPDGELHTEWLTLSSITNGQNGISHYVAVFSNVSQLLQRQRKLERIANHDPLTDLPNRLLLRDRLEVSITYAKRTGDMLAVCYMDLDGFKPINDRLGHDAGDKVLCAISQRIKGIVRDNDTAARMGGDEFVILLGQLKNPEDCRIILDRILEDIAEPVQIGEHTAQVTTSIGVAIYPMDGKEAMILLKHADKAMYQAKNTGKCRYHFYSE